MPRVIRPMRVPASDLRTKSDALLTHVQQGESVVVTEGGEPVAQVIPLTGRGFSKQQLLETWAKLPPVDSARPVMDRASG